MSPASAAPSRVATVDSYGIVAYCGGRRPPLISDIATKVRIIRQTAENSGANCLLYTKNARIYRVVVLFFSLFIVSYY